MENLTQHPLYKKYNSDSVISETFRFYKKHFLLLFLISLFISIIVQIPIYKLSISYNSYIYSYDNIPFPDLQFIGSMIILWLGVMIIYSFIFLFICNYTYQSGMEGATPISVLKSTITDYYLKFIVVSIISVIIIMVGGFAGIVVFIIGILFSFLYVMTALSPISAILVIEDKDIFDTIGRSFSLIHKDFWGALGAVVLLILLFIILAIVISIFTIIPYSFNILGELTHGASISDIIEGGGLLNSKMPISAIIINTLFSSLTFPIVPLFSVVMYFKLKYAEDHKEAAFENRPY